MTGYDDKRARLAAALAAADHTSAAGLSKRTSNLFRDRVPKRRPSIDLAHFDAVIRVDPAAGVVEAEGMAPYSTLVEHTLAHGTMPAVVPQLKSITLGGAVAGVGIEASSFRHGLVHDTICALDVLTGDGRILRCTPDNEHRDLFFGFPNSYGTLGYALAVTARTLPVKPYVAITHTRYARADDCFAAMAASCDDPTLDFLDGTVFGPDEIYLTSGRFADTAPQLSDYTCDDIYYRSIRTKRHDWLTVHDYLWRWDTDWFWCSKNVGAQNPVVRRLLGRKRLNSITYQRIMRWNSRWGLTRAVTRLRGGSAESVIQDVDIPLPRAAEFLSFLHREIGILPIWLCPIRVPADSAAFPLYPLQRGAIYVNFGFWDVVPDAVARPEGYRNRKIEREVARLRGVKSLYSDSYYSEDEFWRIFDKGSYAILKAKYDPALRLPDLYAKCVLRR